MSENVLNKLLDLAIENNKELHAIKKHLFNGLTEKVNALAERHEACKFDQYLSERPDMHPAAIQVAAESRKRSIATAERVKDVLLLALSLVVGLKTLNIL